jgi:hypothetical protein
MAALSQKDKGLIQLIIRSPDSGDGWRNVSKTLWPLVNGFSASELIEKDMDGHRVRLSELGYKVAEYLQ